MPPAEPRPNIVVISTGLRYNILDFLPHVTQVWKTKGRTYTNAFTTTALAGISRVNFMTGKLASVHGFKSHHWADDLPSIFATHKSLGERLHDASYKTAMIGGFMYSYSSLGPPNGSTWYVAPGWDKWWALANDPLIEYLGYTIVTGPSSTFTAGSTQADFLVDKMGDEAVAWIAARESANERPWFVYMMAPGGGIPDRHAGTYNGAAAHRPASYNEADVTDKCAGIQALSNVDSAFVDATRINSLNSYLVIDDLCKKMHDAVQAYDPTNTVLLLIGQGGPFWGEHRLGLRETYPGDPPPWLRFASNMPYDEAHRLAMVMVFPKELAPGSVEDRMILSQDVTATLARWAAASTTGLYGNALSVCGRSNRKSMPLEGWQVEGEDFYTGTRTRTSKTFTWHTGETETYDLVADPNEMNGTLT